MDVFIKEVDKFSPFSGITDDKLSKFREICRKDCPETASVDDCLKFIKFFRKELMKKPLPINNDSASSAFEECGVIVRRLGSNIKDNEMVNQLFDECVETIIKVYEEDCVTSDNYSSLRSLIHVKKFTEYAETNTTDIQLKRLINAFKREFDPKGENDLKQWAGNMPYPAGELLESFSSKAVKESKKEFIEIFIFWAETALKYKEKDSDHVFYLYLIAKVRSIFERPLEKISKKEKAEILFINLDTEVYDYAFSKCQKIMFSPDFLSNRYPKDVIELLITTSLTYAIKNNPTNKLLAKAYDFSYTMYKNDERVVKRLVDSLFKYLNGNFLTIDFVEVGMKSHYDQFLDEIANIRTGPEANQVVDLRKKHFQEKQDKENSKKFLKVLLENPWDKIIRTFFVDAMNKNLINFHQNPDIFSYTFDLAYKTKIYYDERSRSGYWTIGSTICEVLQNQGLISKLKKDIFRAIEATFDFSKHQLHDFIVGFIQTLKWKGEISTFKSILVKLKIIIDKKENICDAEDKICRVTKAVFEQVNIDLAKNRKLLQIKDALGELFNACYNNSWSISNDDSRIAKQICIGDDEKRTLAGQILKVTMNSIYQYNFEFTALFEPTIETLRLLRKRYEDKELQKAASETILGLSDKIELIGIDTGHDIIDQFIEERSIRIFGKVTELYPSCADYIHKHLEEIQDIAEDEGQIGLNNFVQLVTKIGQHNPKEITQKMVDFLIDYVDGPFAFTAIQQIILHRVETLENYHDNFANAIKFSQYGGLYIPDNIILALCTTEERAKFYSKALWEKHLQNQDTPYTKGILYALQQIAQKYKNAVVTYQKEIQNMKDGKYQSAAADVINVLEGRTLANVANDVEEQREDIDNLDSRVTNNEDKIENLDNDVRETKEDVANVKQDVKETKERIDQIEYTIKGLDERVEELSHMTLSHAPAWTRHVSELMNDQTDHDWRLLAMKLNYTNDDIRNWATQPDPCLSMFDEWFATHKTREATNAILTNLKEMNRLDAAEIVESALANVKDVVQDDEDEEFEKPEVFLSYQWGHQQEVKLLRKHLEMAGFKAWMDIGQMGGGDKLYAKIDDGVRSAKVIISCVSEKYAKSANCCREVNLSTNLGKPMIPILMEQLSWPPAGPMGPIMSEYLYIRFFKSGGMEKGDSVFWLPAKFQELLMQVRYFVVPDMKLITNDSPYKGWMNPPEEEIIIPKREQKAIESSNGKSEENTEQEVSPDVFISYQWGKQPQIKRLYKKLSEMGYYCWLDIMQMGGGDSLFDKIDKGIRGAKVIISCVTPKYALSANCRREVSLSGALSKPIVPLLLEDMKWPPEGPMSMTFTELLYIGFHRKKDDKLWEGDEFNQLISKIDLNAPGCRTLSTSSRVKDQSTTVSLNKKSVQKNSEKRDDTNSLFEYKYQNSNSNTSGACQIL
ncbi:DgyrCDS8671 [Dimorphilus gyrociliatus]|uniref:DgyrCDS8671 n=1 Tax=Dimorphilus gyrociliatus TaxID=2664684 RepID=A0A7I8VUT6_9ANNE|nr:DgyrCDS8671 [Dimorphilus gyrociliatus]